MPDSVPSCNLASASAEQCTKMFKKALAQIRRWPWYWQMPALIALGATWVATQIGKIFLQGIASSAKREARNTASQFKPAKAKKKKH